jgi:hypothetical protein
MPAAVPTAASPRLDWADVPDRVRAWVDAELGSPVVRATTVLGGFSPGAAARLLCDDGTRAFVKAVSERQNPDTPDLNRRETRALQALGQRVPHAALLSSLDDDGWVGLLFENVDGRRPEIPWSAQDVQLMARTLALLADTTADPRLPSFDEVAHALTAWDEIATHPAGIAPHLIARLPEMLDRQALAP